LLNKPSLGKLLSKPKLSLGRRRAIRVAAKRKFSLPATVFEFQPEYVLGVRFSGSFRRVANLALGELDADVLSPQLGRPNILRPEDLARRVAGVASVLGGEKGSFGLLLPDGAVRVSILEFETLPTDRKEQESLIRWKMKPLLPFPTEDALLSFELAPKEPEGMEAVVMAVKKSVLAEYESMLDALNGEVSLVLPSSAALLPLLNDNAGAGEMLLNISPTHLTAVVVNGQQIRLWRNHAMNGKSSGEGLIAVIEEASRTLAASHDRLGLEISLVRICSRPGVPRNWVMELGRKLSRDVEDIVPKGLPVRMKLSYEEGQILNEFGATVSGLVANAA
jgi:hypothetical protein